MQFEKFFFFFFKEKGGFFCLFVLIYKPNYQLFLWNEHFNWLSELGHFYTWLLVWVGWSNIFFLLAARGLPCCLTAFSSCGVLASHCFSFSCWGVQAQVNNWFMGLFALQRRNLPGAGIEQCPLHWQATSYPLDDRQRSQEWHLLKFKIFHES